MNIQTAAKYIQLGYRIHRVSWDDGIWISVDNIRQYSVAFSLDDLLADDWEIITAGVIKDFPITYSE